jgi:16S rRNA (guanine527-N7)-methyltransferase
VTHPPQDVVSDVVASELERAGVAASPRQSEALAGLLQLLERWGRRINLTATPDPCVVARRLLPDALVLSAQLDPPPRDLLDVGAGPGLLGLTLALLRPSIRVALVEANRRKCAFLRTAAHELKLEVTVLEGRVEALRPARVDLAGSRATLPPAAWLALGAQLVRPGGRVVAFLVEQQVPQVPPALQLDREVSYRLHDGTPRLLALYRHVSRET